MLHHLESCLRSHVALLYSLEDALMRGVVVREDRGALWLAKIKKKTSAGNCARDPPRLALLAFDLFNSSCSTTTSSSACCWTLQAILSVWTPRRSSHVQTPTCRGGGGGPPDGQPPPRDVALLSSSLPDPQSGVKSVPCHPECCLRGTLSDARCFYESTLVLATARHRRETL